MGPDQAVSDNQKLATIKDRIEALLLERLGILHDEASVLSADMEALLGRLACKGHVAKVDDLKAGRWYRTASDLRLLQNLYSFVCKTMGEDERVVTVPASDDESEPNDGDQDSVVEDE